MSKLRPLDAERRAQRPDSANFSEALARGLSVITAFDDQRRRMTLSDVARAVDLPRATVRRALATLVDLGYLEAEGRPVSPDAAHPEAGGCVSIVQYGIEHPAAGL